MNPRFFAGSRGPLFFFVFLFFVQGYFSSSSVFTLEAFEQHTCRSDASELSSLAYRQWSTIYLQVHSFAVEKKE